MDLSPRYSGESDRSDPLSGRLPDRSSTPTSSQSPLPDDDYSSLQDGHLTMHDRQRGSKRDRGRHISNRKFMEMLVSEELEAKQTRKFLRTALSRLDNETQRAQEAERRALELAERFKVVNDARAEAQRKLDLVSEELRLYKVQYDNARREIQRGQDILKDVELQRDDAEAAAARARTTARRLREQQLMMKSREEGRKAGYQEGLRRGMEQARLTQAQTGTDDGDLDEPAAPLDDGGASIQDDGTATLDSRADPLGDLPVRNFTSPAPTVPLESPRPRRHMVPPSLQPQDPQISRFHEHGIGISPTPTNTTLPSANAQYDQPIRPVSVVNRAPSPHHPDTYVPPDGWVPEMGEDNRIRLPPPHEMQRSQTPTSPNPVPIPPPSSQRQPEPQFISRDYAHHKPSTPSIDSIPTTSSMSVSQFDLVNSPRQTHRNLSNSDRKLSTIHEVASASDFSPRHSPSVSKQPSFDARSPQHRYERSSGDGLRTSMPEAIVFPGVPQVSEQLEDPAPAAYSPRSRAQSQVLADSLRYGHPDIPAEMRRSVSEVKSNPSMGSIRSRLKTPSRLTTPAPLGGPLSPQTVVPQVAPQDYLRPSSTLGPAPGGPPRTKSAMSNRSDNSSRYAPSLQDIMITVEPASGPPSSGFSPPQQAIGMLSPSGSVVELPPQHQPTIPTAPNSPEMGHFQSMGAIMGTGGAPSMQKVNALPPGFIPSAPPSPAPPNVVLIPPSRPMSRSGLPMGNIYSQPPPMAVPEVQRSASSGSSGPSTFSRAVPMHSRSRSAGQASVESFRSKTPLARPPSSSSGGGGPSIYQAAPIPLGVTYPSAPGPPVSVPSRADTTTPQSTTSKKSGHSRSRSMHAGSTPALSGGRPLSTAPAPKLRRVPSDASVDSAVSGLSREYAHYEPQTYVDPAFLASTEELPLPFSPNTQANTRANAFGGPPQGNRSSSALSYGSSHRFQ